MPEPEIPPAALASLELVAAAIRGELGEAIDAYPGCRAPERADPLNRAFRAVARALLAAALGYDVPPGIVSRALRQAAERRLLAEGWDGDQVRHLVEQEPGSPDDWLIFLLLSSRAQIEPLLGPDDPA